MDVIPEIQARLGALERRADALEDGQEHLTKLAQASGTLAAATAGGPSVESQPGVIPQGPHTEPLI